MDQPGQVANPARGQLNRENSIPLSPCVPENLVSRDGFSRPVPRKPAHLHTQAESWRYLKGRLVTVVTAIVHTLYTLYTLETGHLSLDLNGRLSCLKKNLNASRPSEHPPDRGKKY